jgi:superfamily I DNA/RNA helicase
VIAARASSKSSWRTLGIEVRGRTVTPPVDHQTRPSKKLARGYWPRTATQGALSDTRVRRLEYLADVAAEAATVRQTVETWLSEGIGSHEIGLFVRTPQLVARARAAIAGLTGEGKMMTAPLSLAKGLEFRAVVVMACDEGILPLDERVAEAAEEAELDDIYETERRLLYVACTRAREHLLLTGVTPTSEYLADFAS